MVPSIELKNVKENMWLLLAAFSFLIYSLIEIVDSVAIVLISLNIIPNLYLEFDLSVPFIRDLLESQPSTFILFFWAFTVMRIMSTIGLFKNRLWGFWIGLISLSITMVLDILFFPLGAFELFACSLILSLMIVGYFKDKPIL